jgi:hypothetical protein
MKKNITLYLFVFTLLILIFQLVNSNKVLQAQDAKLGDAQKKASQLQEELQEVQARFEDEVYFSLPQNEGAGRFFPNADLEALQTQVESAVYDLNVKKGNNPLIPYAGMDGRFFFNKVKVLNHKWLVADFSDGTHWGEVLVAYTVTAEGTITFNTIAHLLYPVEE